MHKYLIEVKKLIRQGGGRMVTPNGVTFGQVGLGWPNDHASKKKKMNENVLCGQNPSRVNH